MEVFCKKSVLTNLAKFKGKHMCQSLHFHKFAGLRKKKKINACQLNHSLCIPSVILISVRIPVVIGAPVKSF